MGYGVIHWYELFTESESAWKTVFLGRSCIESWRKLKTLTPIRRRIIDLHYPYPPWWHLICQRDCFTFFVLYFQNMGTLPRNYWRRKTNTIIISHSDISGPRYLQMSNQYLYGEFRPCTEKRFALSHRSLVCWIWFCEERIPAVEWIHQTAA